MFRVSSLNAKESHDKHCNKVNEEIEKDLFTDTSPMRDCEFDEENFVDDGENLTTETTPPCTSPVSTPDLFSYNGFVLGEKSKNSLFSMVEAPFDDVEGEDLTCPIRDEDTVVNNEIAQALNQDNLCLMCVAGPMLEEGMERVAYVQKYNALSSQHAVGEISRVKLYNNLVALKQNIDREKDIEENSIVDVMRKCKIQDMYVHIVKDHDGKGSRDLKVFAMSVLSDLYSYYRRMEDQDLRNYDMLAKILERFQNVLAREGK